MWYLWHVVKQTRFTAGILFPSTHWFWWLAGETFGNHCNYLPTVLLWRHNPNWVTSAKKLSWTATQICNIIHLIRNTNTINDACVAHAAQVRINKSKLRKMWWDKHKQFKNIYGGWSTVNQNWYKQMLGVVVWTHFHLLRLAGAQQADVNRNIKQLKPLSLPLWYW